MEGICELCGREEVTTSHHLIPKQVHSKNWCKKKFSRDEMKNRRADLCADDCHPTVHKFFTHKELARNYNTVELLLTNEKIQNYVAWVQKQKKKKKSKR